MDYFQHYLDHCQKELQHQLIQFKRGGITSVVFVIVILALGGKHLSGLWIFLGGLALLPLFQLRVLWSEGKQRDVLQRLYCGIEDHWQEIGGLLAPYLLVREQIEAEHNCKMIGMRGGSSTRPMLHLMTHYMQLYYLIKLKKIDCPQMELSLWGVLIYHQKINNGVTHPLPIDLPIFGKASLLEHLKGIGDSWLINILNGYRSMLGKEVTVEGLFKNHFSGGRFKIITRDQFQNKSQLDAVYFGSNR